MKDLSMDLFAYRVVPVVVLDDARDAEPLGRALVEGGLPVAEVTFRTAAAPESIAIMSQIPGLLVGAGTVTTPQQVALALDKGASFVVSPGLRSDIVQAAQQAAVPVLPGAVTPSELLAAQALGIDTVKFFPAQIYGGAKAIKALAAPFTTMKFVPTGGIDLTNLPDYLALSCVPAVGGSWMVPKHLIQTKNFAAIAQLSAEAVAAAKP